METLTVEQAADRLIPQPEAEVEAEQTTQDVEVEAEETEVEVEATQPEVDNEDGEEEVEVEAEADIETDDETDEPTEQDDGYETPEYIHVKVDGEDIQVTLDDLKRSFSGQGKIQKGMQEAAEMRKHSEATLNALQAEQQRFLQSVQALQQQGLKQPPQAPNEAMVETDPIGYIQDKARFDKEMGEYNQQQTEIQRVQEQQNVMQTSQQQEFLSQQAKIAQERIPELADPKVAGKFKETLIKTGIDAYGFTGDEMNSIMDARAINVLSDAYRWRNLQNSKVSAKKAPVTPKSVKPTGKRETPKNVVRNKQVNQAKRSGKLEDFAALLLNNG